MPEYGNTFIDCNNSKPIVETLVMLCTLKKCYALNQPFVVSLNKDIKLNLLV